MTRLDLRTLALISAGCIGLSGGCAHGVDDHHANPPKPATTTAPAKPAAKPAKSETAKQEPAKQEHADVVESSAPAPAHATANPAAKTEPKVEAKPETKSEAKAESKAKTTENDETPNSETALKMLREGNERWVNNKMTDPNTDTARRAMLADKGQKPFAIVLTCADSRVPAERVFDRGAGDLFVIRVAGNVAGTSETGTIEYGVGHLKAPLLVVMGHTKCGAVGAVASGAQTHGKLSELLTNISPAVERAHRNNPDAEGAQLAAISVKENVWQSIFDLIKYSPEVRSAISSGELKVVGAVCDISSGKVEWMGEHPWQAELVTAMNARAEKSTETAGASDEHKDH